MSTGEDRCAGCGARLFGAPWCGQCGRKLEGAVAVDTRPPGRVASRPVRPAVLQPAELRETRWKGTATTFSGPTKVLFTVLLVAFPAIPAILELAGGLGFDPIMLAGDGTVWFVVAFVLRSLWRKGRVASGGPGRVA